MNKKVMCLLILFLSPFTQSKQVVWDLSFDDVFNTPQLSLTIANQNIIFTLDTGAKSALYLPMTVINKIPNIVEQPNKIKSIDLAGNITEARSFIINELKLNQLLFNNITVVEYKNWGLSFASDNSDTNEYDDINPNVIGLDLFNNYVLTINYPDNHVIVSDEQPMIKDDEWVAIPFNINDEGIVINMSDGSKNHPMILDTAASTSMIKAQSLTSGTHKIRDNDSDFELVNLELTAMANTKTDAIIFDSFPAEFKSDGLLGGDFLSNNLVKIDFKNKKLWIKHIDDSEMDY